MTKKTDARAAQNAIAQALGQHVSYQHRASSAVVNAVNKRIHELAGVLAIELRPLLDDLTPAELRLFLSGQYKTNRLKKLRDAIKEFGDESGAALAQEWEVSAPKLAAYEVGYTATMMNKVIEGMPKIKASGDAAYKRAMATPLAGSPPYGGKLVQELLDGFGGTNADRVMASLRAGMASGQSNSQLLKAIRGTKALNYQDGVVQIARGDAERFIRTARSHVSNQAMTDVYEQLGVAEVIDVATLDGRTCLVAGELVNTPDGERPVEKIKAGDMVYGGSGQVRQVAAAIKSTSRRLCRVRLSNGKSIICTPDHPFLTDGGWMEAKDLSAGTVLPERLI